MRQERYNSNRARRSAEHSISDNWTRTVADRTDALVENKQSGRAARAARTRARPRALRGRLSHARSRAARRHREESRRAGDANVAGDARGGKALRTRASADRDEPRRLRTAHRAER